MDNNIYQELNTTIIHELEKFNEENIRFIKIFSRKIFEELQLKHKEISEYQLDDIIINTFNNQLEVVVNRKITNIKDHLLNQVFSIKNIQLTTPLSNQLFNNKLKDIKDNVNRYDVLNDDIFLNEILPNMARELKIEINSYEYDNLRILINDSITKITDNFCSQKRKLIDKLVDNELVNLNINQTKNQSEEQTNIANNITNENKEIILSTFQELKLTLDVLLATNTSSHYKFILGKYNLELQESNFLENPDIFNKFINISNKLFDVMIYELVQTHNIKINSTDYNDLKILVEKYQEEFNEKLLINYNNYAPIKLTTFTALDENISRRK